MSESVLKPLNNAMESAGNSIAPQECRLSCVVPLMGPLGDSPGCQFTSCSAGTNIDSCRVELGRESSFEDLSVNPDPLGSMDASVPACRVPFRTNATILVF